MVLSSKAQIQLKAIAGFYSYILYAIKGKTANKRYTFCRIFFQLHDGISHVISLYL